MKTPNKMLPLWAAGLCAAGAVGGLALARHKTAAQPTAPKMVYSPRGFGGYVPAPKQNAAPVVSTDPVLPALAAYQRGQYAEAERLAEAVMRRCLGASEPKAKRDAAFALWVDAYSAARPQGFLHRPRTLHLSARSGGAAAGSRGAAERAGGGGADAGRGRRLSAGDLHERH